MQSLPVSWICCCKFYRSGHFQLLKAYCAWCRSKYRYWCRCRCWWRYKYVDENLRKEEICSLWIPCDTLNEASTIGQERHLWNRIMLNLLERSIFVRERNLNRRIMKNIFWSFQFFTFLFLCTWVTMAVLSTLEVKKVKNIQSQVV